MLMMIFAGFSCNDSTTSPAISDYSFLISPEGSNISLEYPNGNTESVGSDRVIGWLGGQLLEGNYYRQLRIGTDVGTLDFRISLPQDISFNDIVVDTHELRETRLLLEETTGLNEVVAELFFGFSDDFEGLENAGGTVTLEQDINHEDQTYDIVGEINAVIQNIDGEQVKLSGNFWKQNAD